MTTTGKPAKAFRALIALLLCFGVSIPLAAEADQATVYRGDVLVDVWWGVGLVAALDAESDGTYERFFALQIADVVPPEIPLHLSAALVVVKDHGLVAFDDHTAVSMALTSSEERIRGLLPNLLSRHTAERTDLAIYHYRGHGWIWNSTPWPPPELDVSPTRSGSCDAGGPGSTACNITCQTGRSCGTTCGSGSYSCCTCIGSRPQCTCQPNSSGGGGTGGGNGGGGGTCDVSNGGWCPPECMSCTSAY